MALHAVTAGDLKSAAPLVLLHGFGGGAFVWRDIMEGLGDAHPLIAFDLPGHCQSLQAEGIGAAGRMAKAVIGELDRLGIERFHVAGHSLGGAIAAILAMRNPGRVRSATLFAPGGIGPAINHRALAHYALAQSYGELRRALEAMVGFNAPIPHTLVEAMLDARRAPGAREALEKIFDAMLVETSFDGREQGTLPMDEMAKLAMPVRVVWGGEDCILPIGQTDHLPANISLYRIAQAGHMLIDECPQQAVSLLRKMIG